jgi:hypothetical protein
LKFGHANGPGEECGSNSFVLDQTQKIPTTFEPRAGRAEKTDNTVGAEKMNDASPQDNGRAAAGLGGPNSQAAGEGAVRPSRQG